MGIENTGTQNMEIENTEWEEPEKEPENTEELQEMESRRTEGKGRKEKKRKKDKPKRSGRSLRAVLRIVQHASLAVLVFSVIVIAASMIVQISRHSGGNYYYTEIISYPEPGVPFEDSDAFFQIFGYAVADVVRAGVVSGQMETDGVYDGSRLVDVTAYNHRNDTLPEEYVTAVYRLEDLIKWYNHGFSYTTEMMTEQEQKAFFAGDSNAQKLQEGQKTQQDQSTLVRVQTETAKTNVTVIDDNSGFVEEYQPIGDLGNHAGQEYAVEVLENTEEEDDSEDDEEEETAYSYADILVNRYRTVDGKNLENCVSNWAQYYELIDNVRTAAESLAYNYNEYVAYNECYDTENSNVRYLIEKTVGDETLYYSNMEKGSAYRDKVLQLMNDMDQADAGKEMAFPYEKFIYYNLADMTCLTNTDFGGNTMRKILQDYDYAYPENSRIWIGVDTSYPAYDAFAQGKEYLPNFWQWVAAAIVSGLLYLALFVYQMMVTGREYDEDGNKRIRLNTFDRISTEPALLIAFLTALIVMWIVVIVIMLINADPTELRFYHEAVREDWFKAAIFGGVFAADAIFSFFFYSLVRRIKARTLFKNSYLYRLLRWLKKFIWKVYDNAGVVLRIWVPYGVFLLINFLMMVCAYNSPIVLVFACIIDVIVGVLLYKDAAERQGIVKGIETIAGGQVEYQINTENLHGDNKVLANAVNSIGNGIKEAVEISMKDERMKADLITNVSHDIKTPLTSIINYVDLLKRERVDNEKVQSYIRILDEKSQRLKQLTDDLVEASKITSGNISYHFEKIDMRELLNQTIGEFSEKFETKNLMTIMNVNTRDTVIEADSRRIWRVMENLFGNIYKYAMPGTRVYVSISSLQGVMPGEPERIEIAVKNISENPLNCKPEELTERFIRGDESRTTEGSGLGLSIAKNLTVAQGGSFEIELEGDLFKVFLTFPVAAGQETAGVQ